MKKREKRPMDMRRAHALCKSLVCACGVLAFMDFIFLDIGPWWLHVIWIAPIAVLGYAACRLDKRYVRCPHCKYPLSASGPGEVPDLGRFCPGCGKELPR